MCGITGFWNQTADASPAELERLARRMAATLHHRGPDDAGAWSDPEAGVGLGQTRLAIIDLSPGGHQPMSSACGRFTIVFNGEIYNHAELRAELKDAYPFRSHSDTEVLLAGTVRWGLRATIQRCIGMFAIALWDRRERTLTLVRDRMGIKPLYYGRQQQTLFFGSELKALRAHPAYRRELDRGATLLFLKHGYVPTPCSIDAGTKKLPPGTMLTLSPGQSALPEPEPFWSFDDIARRGQIERFSGTRAEAVDRLEALLADAVRLRMIADVPLGAFLSGGIDSSAVVALMQSQSGRPVKTFSIGFEQSQYDEAPFARRVAEHLRTDHTEHYVTAAQAQAVIPRLPTMFDEPFADSSQIPTFLVCELARRHVTVALSGDGGDELFCGYSRYFHPYRLAWLRTLLPGALLPAVSGLCQTISRQLPRPIGRLFRGAGRLLADTDAEAVYCRNMCYWQAAEGLLPEVAEPPTLFGQRAQWPEFADQQRRWMWIDARTYLPDDILTKVDRTSMAVALEARVPLIDHRIVEFSWTLPLEWQLGPTGGKQLLRDVLARHVPREMFERPKLGFGVPLGEWLRGPLRDWSEDLLSVPALSQDGLLNPQPIRRAWQDHVAGRVDWKYWLWPVLMLQAWRQSMVNQEIHLHESPDH